MDKLYSTRGRCQKRSKRGSSTHQLKDQNLESENKVEENPAYNTRHREKAPHIYRRGDSLKNKSSIGGSSSESG